LSRKPRELGLRGFCLGVSRHRLLIGDGVSVSGKSGRLLPLSLELPGANRLSAQGVVRSPGLSGSADPVAVISVGAIGDVAERLKALVC
jgi:hypothetical protein